MAEESDGGGLMMLGMVALVLVWLTWVWAGSKGISHTLGGWWAFAAVVAALMFRFALPLCIGVFFCAKDVWGWHWAGALLLAAPGLLFMIPALVTGLLESFRSARSQ